MEESPPIVTSKRKPTASKTPKPQGLTGVDPLDPLVGDPGRRAGGALAGYDYQLWLSVLAWVRLSGSEALFVEGSEDLDLVRQSSATTIQVKRTSERVTLNSKDAISALDHFLICQQRNPEKSILFRYHTTSEAGREKIGALFEGMGGIEVWTSISNLPYSQNLDSRIRFIIRIINRKATSGTILSVFLKSGSPKIIHEQLISKFTWAVAQGGTLDVQRTVLDLLVLHGEARAVPSSECEKVADRLYSEVMKAATAREPSQLLRADFLRVFDAATSISVPAASYSQFFGRLLGAEIETFSYQEADLAPPLLPNNLVPRQELIDSAIATARSTGVLWLFGGTGYGKSILAAQCSNALGTVVSWFDLRDAPEELVSKRLSQALKVAQYGVGRQVIVLDDLLTVGMQRPKIDLVSAIVRAAKGRTNILIVTAYDRPPVPLVQVGVRAPSAIEVGSFSSAEVEVYLTQVGCPDDRVSTWTKIIYAQTSGHPQLVSLLVCDLAERGFPYPSANDFLETPTSVEQAREEAAVTLVARLPDQAKDALYGLSLTTYPFRRELALCFMSNGLGDPRPGEALSTIQSRWLEKRSADYFRISPLISGIGRAVLDPDRTESFHKAIARCALKSRNRSQYEIAAALFHALAGKDDKILVALSGSFIQANDDVQKAYSDYVGWFAYVGLEGDKELTIPLDFRPPVRAFQLALSEIMGHFSLSEEVVRVATIEMSKQLNTSTFAPVKLLFYMRALGDVATSINWRLTLQAIGDAIEIIASHGPTISQVSEGTGVGLVEAFWSMSCIKPCGTSELLELFDHLGVLSSDRRTLILSSILYDEHPISALFEQVWAKTPEDAREILLPIYNRTMVLGVEWKSAPIVHISARILSLIYDESLRNPEEALRILDRAAADWGESFSMSEQRSSILFGMARYEECLEIVDRILRAWDSRSPFDITPFTARRGAIASVHLGRLNIASEMFAEAAKRARDRDMATMAIGLVADEGVTLWWAEEYSSAVVRLYQAVRALEKVPNVPSHPAGYSLHKLIGHAIGWIVTQLDPERPSLPQPVPGGCSNPLPHSGLLDHPMTPLDFSRYTISEIAFRCGDDSIFDAFKGELLASDYFPVAHLARILNIKISYWRKEYRSIIDLVSELGIVEAEKRKECSPEEYFSTSVMVYFTWVVLAICERRDELKSILSDWRSRAPSLYSPEVLASKLDWIFNVLGYPESTLVASANSDLSIQERAICAALAIGAHNLPLVDSLICQLSVLLFADKLGIGSLDAEVAQLIEDDWEIMEARGKIHPKLILTREVVTDGHRGISRAARSVLCGIMYTRIRISPDVKDTLRRISGDEMSSSRPASQAKSGL